MMTKLTTQIRQWYPEAVEQPRLRLNYKSEQLSLQLKIDRRTKAVVIVLVQLREDLRGKGWFSKFTDWLSKNNYSVIVDCPQPRLQAYCDRNGIAYNEC